MPHLTDKRYAICIGVNQYTPSAQLRPLDYAEKDAEAVYNLLLHMGFGQEHCCLLTGPSATLEAINKALRAWVLNAPQRNDLVLFYFAGHSVPILPTDDEEEADSHSEVFLAPYDFDEQQIKENRGFRLDEALGMERLRSDFFARSRSSKVLFIFDSCHSGDFFGPPYRGEVADPVQGYIKQLFASTKAGGHVVLSSCLPIQIARENAAFGHGIFTHHLLEALEGKAKGALRHNGCVTVGSLFDYLCEVLPQDQRPVRGGVEQDAFELVCYPDQTEQTYPSITASEVTKRAEREVRLRVMLADHTGFMRDRLESFVGREAESVEIRRRIQEKLQTGGYVTITGQAGQGKSSVIAKLVEEDGTENVAFHFIPFNPGPDHQVGLLRNLMARLILKYDLSDLYVASESRPALRDYFPKVLKDIVTKGGQEVIFVDGLDQLEAELSGERDLSFLPNNPPKGVVFVLGTRPNDTLRPLELLKPRYEYQLPNISRYDFNLILDHRGVQLKKDTSDRLYQVMGENALYLDLIAKELAEQGEVVDPEELIKRLADNPEHIFSLAIARLSWNAIKWREIIKPILGVLLVAREPLGLRHIRQIIEVEDDRLRDGLERLGGLITRDWQQRYSLFHLKLYEYLRQNQQLPAKEYVFALDEEKAWHSKFARWCEGSDLSAIWRDVKLDSIEQKRREYSRQHYLTHLYSAQEWQRLFAVLDEGSYGRGKVRYDPSTRSYAQDLDLGRQASVRAARSFEEGIMLLPQLWRYTFLRCSLTSRADNYTPEAFESLVLLKREQEALGLAELLTKSDYKVNIFILIAQLLARQPDWEQESLQLLIRAHEVAKSIEDNEIKDGLLKELSLGLARIQQWERAEAVARSVETIWIRTRALGELGSELAKAQRWEHARSLASFIEDSEHKARVLSELSVQLFKAQQWEYAKAIWTEMETMAHAIKDSKHKARVLGELGLGLARAEQWERAEVIAHTINDNERRTKVLGELGLGLARAEQWERAEAVIRSIDHSERGTRLLGELGIELARAQKWEQAEAVVFSIRDDITRLRVLVELGIELARVKRDEQAKVVWTAAETIIHSIQVSKLKAELTIQLGTGFAKARQWRRAKVVYKEVLSFVRERGSWRWKEEASEILSYLAMELAELRQRKQIEVLWTEVEEAGSTIWDLETRAKMIVEHGSRLTEASQLEQATKMWDEALTVAHTIPDKYARVRVFLKLINVLARANQREQAEAIWEEVEAIIRSVEDEDTKAEVLSVLGIELAKLHQWKYAEEVAHSIELAIAKATVLGKLGIELAKEKLLEPAQAIWTEIKTLVYLIEDEEVRSEVLSSLSRELIMAQQWEQAKVITDLIEDSRLRVKVLGELGRELDEAEMREQAKAVWVEAEEVARSIEHDWLKMRVLEELGIECARAWRWKRAIVILRSIKESERRVKILRELSIELVRAEEWERAEAIARSIKDNVHRERVLEGLGIELARAHQWKRAETIASTIEDGERKVGILRVLSIELARAHQWKRAETIASTIEDGERKTIILGELGIELVRTRQWTGAEVIAHSIEDIERRVGVLGVLSVELARAHQWKRAEAITSSIEESERKTRILGELGLELARAHQWKRVEDMVSLIEDSRTKAKMLSELGRELTKAEQLEKAKEVWVKAEDVARSIEVTSIKTKALVELGIELSRAQQWERAEAVIRLIKDRERRARVLKELVIRLARAQQWERAEAIARSFNDSEYKSKILGELSIELARAQRWEQAKAVTRSIEDIRTRAEVLHKLVRNLVNIEDHEQMLHLVQFSWQEADTRTYAFKLLPLVTELIHLNPKVAATFGKTFIWVDSFLKGEVGYLNLVKSEN